MLALHSWQNGLPMVLFILAGTENVVRSISGSIKFFVSTVFCVTDGWSLTSGYGVPRKLVYLRNPSVRTSELRSFKMRHDTLGLLFPMNGMA